jgi:hypothetical protein
VSVYSEDGIHRIYTAFKDLSGKTVLESHALCFPRGCVTWLPCPGLKNKYAQKVWGGLKRNFISLGLVYFYK